MFSGKLKKRVNIIDLGPISMEVGDPSWGGNPFIGRMVTPFVMLT